MNEDADLPEGFEESFWKLVLFLNVGPLAVAVAALIAVFGGPSRVFWASLAVSAVAFFFAARTYFAARSKIEERKEG
jgi:hypothetical protein